MNHHRTLIQILSEAVFVVWILYSSAQRNAEAVESQFDQRAIALLCAVENARKSVDSGHLEIKAVFVSPGVRNEQSLDILFQTDRRRFDVITPQGRGVRVTVREGEMLHYNGRDSCTIRATMNTVPDYCFDPRTMGITGSYSVKSTIESCLAYQSAKAVSFMGDEDINGIMTSHVRVVDAYDQQIDFWIGESEGFPVHQHEFRTPLATRRTRSTAKYDSRLMPTTLPVQVTTKSYNHNGDVVYQRQLAVITAKFDVAIAPETWQLAGLDLPLGTPVVDLRIKERIGYWDGQGLSQDPVVGVRRPIDVTDMSPESQGRSRLLLFLLNLAAVIGLIVFVLLRRRRRSETR